ncbi:MAG: DinB family protein [Chloroflexi bacterium]|nr:DinB family protein [Chloroflexota bacterium]
MNSDTILRQQLLKLLQGGNAHLGFDQAVDDFPRDRINQRPPNVSYTPWHLLEHMRIAQSDILEFIRDPEHVSPQWPAGYWPAQDAQTDLEGWEKTITAFRDDLRDLQRMVGDPETDLLADLPHAPGYTILREVLIVADHNAYHIGEFAILRQVMRTWST